MPNLLLPRDHFKPFEYPWAFEAYRTMTKMAWEPEEAPMAEDLYDWNHKLTEAEKSLLTQLFRFFTQGDVDVASAYRDKYMPKFKKPEIAMMLYSFANSEANHMFAYSFLLDTIGMPDTEYKAFHSFKEMQEKHDYLFKDKTEGLTKQQVTALDLAIFSGFSEGMQLFSSFAMLLSFQKRGLMKGMSTIVEWSIRDESFHVDNMIRLFLTYIEENPKVWTDDFKKVIYQSCREMVELEDHFIDLVFAHGPIEGMTASEVKTYIRYIADRRLNQLGLKANYGIDENPFDWLDWIVTAPTHTNFFEGRSTEYGKGGALNWDKVVWAVKGKSSTVRSYIVETKPDCPWCSLAKHELRARGVRFYINNHPEESERAFYLETAPIKTWPQISVHWEDGSSSFLGGYDDLKQFLDAQ